MSAEVVEVAGLRVWLDRERRRLVVSLPVPCSAFEARGPLAKLWREVCGPQSKMVFDISDHVGGLAICADDEVEAWRAELLAAGGGQ